MEIFYNSMASTLYLQAKPMLTGQPEIEKELDNDLARIDNICSEIKKDLEDNVANQEVIEALIRNYTIKIHILEDMLRILNENENKTEKRKYNEL
jgi:CRISPR/Cas system-associated endonuclease Cas3-HD